MTLSYLLGRLKMLGFVAVPNLCASTGEYYYLIVIIITSSSHFTGIVGPWCPLFSLELYTLFSIVQCRLPGVLLHSLLNCRIWAACHSVCAWGELLYSLYTGAIDGNADEVTEVLDDTRTGEPKERKFWKASLS